MKIILFVISILILASCGSSEIDQPINRLQGKQNSIDKQKSELNKKVKNFVPNKYIESLARKLNIPLKTQRELLKIEKRYNSIKSSMVRSGRWKGEKNHNARLDFLKRRNIEYRRVLGNEKFQQKIKFDKSYN